MYGGVPVRTVQILVWRQAREGAFWLAAYYRLTGCGWSAGWQSWQTEWLWHGLAAHMHRLLPDRTGNSNLLYVRQHGWAAFFCQPAEDGVVQRGEDDSRGGAPNLARLSGSSHVSSPTASGVSDSDTSSYRRASPEKLPPVGEVRRGALRCHAFGVLGFRVGGCRGAADLGPF